ncbi:MAG: hypothetical protein M3256_04595 [Actinomycetota bacterium]|nr:hypothetical protein [Actinomycetota bacterium]
MTCEAQLHHGSEFDACGLAFTFQGPLDDADHAVHVDDVEFQAAPAGLLDAFSAPALDQAKELVHRAHSRPRKRAVQEAGGIDPDLLPVAGGDSPQVVDVAHGVGRFLPRQVLAAGRTPTGRLAWMLADQLAAVEDLHEQAVGADIDLLADVVARDRVERLGHRDVMVATNSRFGVEGNLVARRRSRQEHRLLYIAKVFQRPPLGGAVDAHASVIETPATHAEARGADVGEVLAREPALGTEGDYPFDPGLVPWAPHPTGVNHEAPGLRVLQESRVEKWVGWVRLQDDGLEVVDDGHPEYAAEEDPGLFEAFDDLLQGLAEGRPAELMPAEPGREDEALGDAARLALTDQSKAPEIDLQFVAGLAVGDRDGSAAIAEAQLGDAEAMQRPVWHHQAPTAEQCLDLGQTEPVIQPLLHECALTVELGPALPVPDTSSGPQLRDHRAHHLFADRVLSARQAVPRGHPDVATDGLAVDAEQPLDLSDATTHLPQPQHLPNLSHMDLPEHLHLLREMQEQCGADAPVEGWSLVLG